MRITMINTLYLLIGLWLVAPLWKAARRREALLVAGITLLGAVYSTGLVAGWPLPDPAHWVEVIFRPLAEAVGAL